MAPRTRGMTKGKRLQTDEAPTRNKKLQTKKIPQRQGKARGQRVQPKETTTTSMINWQMVEEPDEEGWSGPFGPFLDEPPIPGRKNVLKTAKKLAKEINITSKSGLKKLTNILKTEGLSGDYEEALQLLIDQKSTVHKSRKKKKVIVESIGEYIFQVVTQAFKFLMELQHEKCWDGEVADIIVKGIQDVPKLIKITIPELEAVIGDAKDVNKASTRWQLSMGEVLRERVFRWRVNTDLEEAIAKWGKSPTWSLKTMDTRTRA